MSGVVLGVGKKAKESNRNSATAMGILSLPVGLPSLAAVPEVRRWRVPSLNKPSTVRTPSLQRAAATERDQPLVRRSPQGEGGSTYPHAPRMRYLLREVLLERLPINLASLNKGHLLQHYNSCGHLPWLQEGPNKVLNRLLRDISL